MNWKVIELMGYAYYAQRGYRILVPLINTNYYDFVVEKEGKFLRVNVKRAGLKDKSKKNSWSISFNRSHAARSKSDSKHADVYLAYLPNKRRFVEINASHFSGKTSRAKLIPKSFVET